ncbi:hypothetical protein [Photorhabdus aegyptia]|uniref:hypothetical protein n=1 Tax=Photorhabdus aegyptia TaxID=2805098 RepID=UPI001E2CAF01|nr:hypothetical protein [Photorhabdus aegyptia]MCC8459086.1 hypothetical protein [Photorhabdus aegyptia]
MAKGKQLFFYEDDERMLRKGYGLGVNDKYCNHSVNYVRPHSKIFRHIDYSANKEDRDAESTIHRMSNITVLKSVGLNTPTAIHTQTSMLATHNCSTLH